MRAATSSAPGAEGDAGATLQGMETAACILASLIVIAFFGLLPGLIIFMPLSPERNRALVQQMVEEEAEARASSQQERAAAYSEMLRREQLGTEKRRNARRRQ